MGTMGAYVPQYGVELAIYLHKMVMYEQVDNWSACVGSAEPASGAASSSGKSYKHQMNKT